jgi:hypothetical protein
MSSPRDQLLQTLAEAASQQPERIKVAEAQLKQWEVVPEFYITLLVSETYYSEVGGSWLL